MVAILCGSLVGNGGNIESFSEETSGAPLMEENVSLTIAGPIYMSALYVYHSGLLRGSSHSTLKCRGQ